MGDMAISVNQIHKDFGEIYAVKDVSFAVKRGEVFSLLGPNGAGKSTLISMLSCLLRPTKGDATVLGHSIVTDPGGVKAVIGVVPQEVALYGDLSARENLDFWGKMYGLSGEELRSRADEVLDLIGLSERQHDRIDKFSGGMKRRVNLGVALLHKPDVIIMDEPTVGIDPQSRRHILDGVKDLNKQGMTVLYTTHYMEEAQELSDHIAIMDQGEIIATGTHDQLVEIVGALDRITLQLHEASADVEDRWRTVSGVSQFTVKDGAITLLAEDSNLVLPQLFDLAAAGGTRITSVNILEPNLESVFLQLTGRALRD